MTSHRLLRVAVGYAIAGWLLLQIAEVTFEPLQLPEWSMTFVILLVLLGFPIAMVLAWARGADKVDSSEPTEQAAVASENVIAEERTIAVLPFRDLSADGDQQYFCDGIAEELTGALARVGGLKVAAFSSAFRHRGADDVRQVGRELGVAAIAEGTVRKQDDRLRITVQLVETRTGFHLMADQFDRKFADVLVIQEEIATSIVQTLKGKLEASERKAIEESCSTSDPEAYDYFLRARDFYYQYSSKSVRFARDLFRQAVGIDPTFAAAYAGIADCYSYLYLNAHGSVENRRLALVAGSKATELAPDLATTHASRAVALSINERHEQAEEEFLEAIRLDPGLFEARYFYARDCYVQGKLEVAAQLYQQAAGIRPDDYQTPMFAAQVLSDLGRTDEAREERIKGRDNAEEHLKRHPDDSRALYLGANALVALGDQARAMEWLRRALGFDPEEPMLLYNAACIYSRLDQPDKALDCLERAVTYGLTYRGWIDRDSDLDPLRSHERFKTLRASLG
jgi:TolB-like protein/lipoprotein NlpI